MQRPNIATISSQNKGRCNTILIGNDFLADESFKMISVIKKQKRILEVVHISFN